MKHPQPNPHLSPPPRILLPAGAGRAEARLGAELGTGGEGAEKRVPRGREKGSWGQTKRVEEESWIPGQRWGVLSSGSDAQISWVGARGAQEDSSIPGQRKDPERRQLGLSTLGRGEGGRGESLPRLKVLQQGRRQRCQPGAGFLTPGKVELLGARVPGSISDTSLEGAAGRSCVTATNTHTCGTLTLCCQEG